MLQATTAAFTLTFLLSTTLFAGADREEIFVNVPPSTPANATLYMTSDAFGFCHGQLNCVKLEKKAVGLYSAKVELSKKIESFNLIVSRGSMETLSAKPNGKVEGDILVTMQENQPIVVDILNWLDKGPLGITGTVEVLGAYYSPQLGNTRNISIWLPPSYKQNTTKRYPVVYMHDGQNVFDPKTSLLGVDWSVDEEMTRLIQEKQVPEAIIVAMDCTRDRKNEYDYLKKGPLYADFVIHTVKPYIDSHYRTLTDREHTTIMGSSMGALISITTIWHHPEVFSKAAGVSFAIHYNHGSTYDALENTTMPTQKIKVYVDSGDFGNDAEYVKPIGEFQEYMEEKHFPKEAFKVLKFPMADHNEPAWARRVHIPLKFLLND